MAVSAAAPVIMQPHEGVMNMTEPSQTLVPTKTPIQGRAK